MQYPNHLEEHILLQFSSKDWTVWLVFVIKSHFLKQNVGNCVFGTI